MVSRIGACSGDQLSKLIDDNILGTGIFFCSLFNINQVCERFFGRGDANFVGIVGYIESLFVVIVLQ